MVIITHKERVLHHGQSLIVICSYFHGGFTYVKCGHVNPSANELTRWIDYGILCFKLVLWPLRGSSSAETIVLFWAKVDIEAADSSIFFAPFRIIWWIICPQTTTSKSTNHHLKVNKPPPVLKVNKPPPQSPQTTTSKLYGIERYFDNSAAELFCKEKIFQKRQHPQSFKHSAIPVKLKLVYLQSNILIVVAVQYHLCSIFCCLINISQTHEIINDSMRKTRKALSRCLYFT